MSDVNPYAAPDSSSESMPAKRPFTKSGARILFVAFVVITFLPALIRLILGILLLSGSTFYLDEPQRAEIDYLIPNLIDCVVLTFVPFGVRLLAQEPRERREKPPQWLRVFAVVSALLTAVMSWSSYLAWHFQHESFNTLVYVAPLLRTASLVSILILVARLAGIRRQFRLRTFAIVTNVVILVDYLIDVLDPFEPSFWQDYLWASLSIGLFINLSHLAILWFARRLEDPGTGPSPKRPRKRSRKGSDEATASVGQT